MECESVMDLTYLENDDQTHIFLMAEDNPADAELFSEMLHQAFGDTYSICCVDRYEQIVTTLREGTFEALILDMDLPDRSGIKNISSIGREYPDLPIVVLTGHDDMELAVNSLQNGAQDYLSKNNVTPEMLSRSVRYAKERKFIEHKLKDALLESAKNNSRLKDLANHDTLTGLPNRTYFHDAAIRILKRANRMGKTVALAYFDLDGFKKVNDTYGHVVGDKLLVEVGKRLDTVIRDSDFLARMGGDEFVIITDIIESKQDVYPLVKRILDVFQKPFEIGIHQIISPPSIGIAFLDDANACSEDLEQLIKHADCAMYEAKEHQGAKVSFYTDRMAAQYSYNQKIESEIANGLERKEIDTWYQPVIPTSANQTIYLETLSRWHSSELGWVSPSEFIPIAELTPAINGITRIVLENTSTLLQTMDVGARKHAKMAVNVSAMQLNNDYFCDLLLEWLELYKIPTQNICLELTERQMVQNAQNCLKNIERLRNNSIEFSLDDFGTGFSSITHLLDFPLDTLKLDRMLIDRIDQNARNQALTAGIVEMAHRLDMKVVAEGVERHEEYQMAVSLGCDFIQGYYISRPLPIEETILYYQLQQ